MFVLLICQHGNRLPLVIGDAQARRKSKKTFGSPQNGTSNNNSYSCGKISPNFGFSGAVRLASPR
jgi:hypothetical protein